MKKYCYFSSMRRNRLEVIMYRQGRSLISDGFEVFNVVSDDQPLEVVQGVKITPSGYFRRSFSCL